MQGLVTYIVDQGYDAEDLLSQLGLTKAVSTLHRLLFSHADKLNNANFIV